MKFMVAGLLALLSPLLFAAKLVQDTLPSVMVLPTPVSPLLRVLNMILKAAKIMKRSDSEAQGFPILQS